MHKKFRYGIVLFILFVSAWGLTSLFESRPGLSTVTSAPDMVGLRQTFDSQGAKWILFATKEADGSVAALDCFKIHTAIPATTNSVARAGVCGFTGVVFNGVAFISTDSSIRLLPSIAHVQLPDPPGSSTLHTLIYGIATCACRVQALLSDGRVLEDTSLNGTFLMRAAGDVQLRRVQAVDSLGLPIVAWDNPLPQDVVLDNCFSRSLQRRQLC